MQSEEDQQHWQKQVSGHPADRCACCWHGSGASSWRRISCNGRGVETSLDGSAIEWHWWTIIFRERFTVLLLEFTKEINLKGEINVTWKTVIFEDRSCALTKTGKKCFVYNVDRELASINNKAKLIPVKLLGFSGLLQSKANRTSFTTGNDMGWYCE